MDTKSLRLEIKNESRGEVSAVFATFNVIDSHGDVTLPGAFEDGAEVVISAYGHTSWEGMLPVGKGRIRQTRTEAIFEGQFFMDTAHGADTFRTVKALGELGQWSYGFDVVHESYGEHDGRRVRFLEGMRVHEVSPVLLGAGVNTRTLATKRDGPREPLSTDQLAIVHKARVHVADLDAHQRAVIERARVLLVAADAEDALRRAQACVQELQALQDGLRDGTVRWYVDLNADDVPQWKRAVVEAAASHYSADLGRPAPRVRWFRDELLEEAHYLELYGEPARPGFGWEGKGRLLGLAVAADGNEIRLNAGMHRAEDLDATVAHEVRHLAGGDERQAQAYEAQARARYWTLEGVK